MDTEQLELKGPDGLRLVYDIAGPKNGAPVILLHGGGQTRRSWAGAMQRLVAEGYRVIGMDLRGHGDSDWAPDGDYSVAVLSADIRAVIATLDRPVALVGASIGGVAAFYTVGVTQSRLTTALVMVDLALRPHSVGAERISGFMAAHSDGFASLEEAAAAVDAYSPGRARPGGKERLTRNLRRRADGRYYWHWDPRLLAGSEAEALEQRFEALVAVSPGVAVPTLLVRGENSDIVSDESVAELKHYVPQTEVLEVKGAGHMVVGDRNDAFNEGIVAFLHRHHPA